MAGLGGLAAASPASGASSGSGLPPSATGTPAGESEASGTQQTAGQLLRQAREAAGMHIATLAVAIKVPVRKLELLEADRLDALPDAVFARALAGSVCRALRIDPTPILARLPDPVRPRLIPDDAGLNEPYRSAAADSRTGRLADVPQPVRWAVLALLVLALALWLLPLTVPERGPVSATAVTEPALRADGPGGGSSRGSEGTAAVPVAPLAPPVPSLAVEQQKVAGVTGVVTPSTDHRPLPAAAAVQAPAAMVAANPSAGPVQSSAAILASPTAALDRAVPAAAAVRSTPTAASPTQGVMAAPGGIVVFSARGASWVEVTDARGSVVLSRLLMPGETVGAGGATPLSVVVGRADATDVTVRGKPFDLAPVARSNVARFEVK